MPEITLTDEQHATCMSVAGAVRRLVGPHRREWAWEDYVQESLLAGIQAVQAGIPEQGMGLMHVYCYRRVIEVLRAGASRRHPDRLTSDGYIHSIDPSEWGIFDTRPFHEEGYDVVDLDDMLRSLIRRYPHSDIDVLVAWRASQGELLAEIGADLGVSESAVCHRRTRFSRWARQTMDSDARAA